MCTHNPESRLWIFLEMFVSLGTIGGLVNLEGRGVILISEKICFEMNILFSLTFSIDEKVTKNLGLS